MSEQTTRAKETMESPGRNFFAVTPSDVTDFDFQTRALWVGGGGNIAVLGVGDTAVVTIVAVPAGTLLPFRCTRVNSTNTTATDIVGIF